MALINNLRKQVDLPVWEWSRFAPVVSAATSCSCAADNSLFHVTHGRYIYYFISSTSFWRYDTWSDTYLQLASAPITAATWTSMRFAGSRGYEGRVISGGSSTITAAAVYGNQLKSYDIRIIGGTGQGQRRIITAVADPVAADYGTASAASATSITDSTKAWAINQWVGYQVRITLFTGVSQVRRVMYNSATVITLSDVNKYSEDPNSNNQFSNAAPLALPVAGSNYQIESSVITVDSAWGTQPDSTSRFIVESGGIYLMSSQATSNYSLMYYDIVADNWYIKTANSGPVATAGTDGTMERCTENSTVWDRGNVSATAASGTAILTDSTKSWTVNQWAGYYVRIFTGTGEGILRPISSNTSSVLTVSSNWGGSGIDATSKYLIVGYDAGTATSAGSESQTASGTASTIAGNIFTAGGSITGTFVPGQILSGTGVGVPVFFNATNTSSGAVITVASTANVNVGQVMTMISGTGTLNGLTTVIAVNSGTTFTVSTAPSVALSGTNVFILSGGGTTYTSAAGATSSGTTVTVTTTANLQVGMMVMVTAGTGSFASATTVTVVNSATTFTVSATPSVALSGGASIVVGTWSLQTILGTQISGTVGGAGTYNVYPQQTVASTTITGTGVATLTDSSKTWTTNRWNNLAVRITAGTGRGQVRSIQGTYQAAGGGVISVVPNWSTTPDSTSTYEIQADVDKLYFGFGASAAIFNYNIAADTLTTGRMEDYGAAAGATAQFSDHMPIAIASGAYANPTMTVTTTNSHNFKTGQSVTIKGDTGAGASLNNITATITVTGATTFTYSVGAGSASMTILAQSTTTLTDASKVWIPGMFAGSVLTYNTAQVAQATGIAAATSVYIIANTSNTLFFAAAGTAPTTGVSRYVITSPVVLPYKNCIGAMDGGLAVGTQSTTTLVDTTKLWTSAATSCSSSGTTVTVTGSGNQTSGLQVGMYVAVTGGTGAFVAGGGTNVTSVQVTAITSGTTFTVSATPTTTLSAATVTGTFWPTNAFVNRRIKFLGATGQYQELAITANTGNTITFAVSVAGVTGTTPYAILQAPLKGAGIEMTWASGMTDTARRGSYIFVPRGGAVLGFDRLNIQTDSWDLMSTTPQFETLTTGSMYAYDGVDRLYFTKEITQRVYYLDLDKSTVHGAGIYPYTAGSAILGNRMEIFTTADGLKYLWLNRHANVECFKQLLFY
jgi:hypothetical protein